MKNVAYLSLAGMCALAVGIIVGDMAEHGSAKSAVEESAAALMLPVAKAGAEPVVRVATTTAPSAKPVPAYPSATNIKTQPTQPVTAKAATAAALKNQLVIPAIGVNAKVVSMGIDPKDGKMSVPNDYKTVGLFSGGAYPGNKGTAVMGAHVDNGAAINGVFKHLKNLKVGEKVYFYAKDGTKLTYEVQSKKVFDYDEKDTGIVFNTHAKTNDNGSLLNIITCTGTWLPAENTYDQRLVVFAKLIR